MKFNLQTHNSRVSYDSTTPPRFMIRRYKQLGFDAIGFVGHDEMSNFESDDLIILNGIEKTIRNNPEIHIVEFPEAEFSFLAHPRRINKENTKEVAEDIIDKHNLDGVEKFNNGVKQYDGTIDTLELANDDAHNLFQIGTSFMTMDINDINEGQLVQALARSNIPLVRPEIELHNKRRRIIGESIKTINSAFGKIIN